MQYNLSYGNDGAGYVLYSGINDGAQTHNAVRFNISSTDVRDQSDNYGGITVVGHVAHTAVYQNTVVMGPHTTGTTPALVLGPKIHGITVRNNVFLIRDGVVVTAQKTALGPDQALLQGNDYYAVAAQLTISWGPAVYSTIEAWQSATGQEMLKGRRIGQYNNPNLRGPLIGMRAKAPGVAWVGHRFAPRGNSPLVGAGLNLSVLFGVNPGRDNFAGQPISLTKPDVGAI
jgi:hypothetical protein